MYEKLTKCRILYDISRKIFPRTYGEGGGMPPTPLSYAYGTHSLTGMGIGYCPLEEVSFDN